MNPTRILFTASFLLILMGCKQTKNASTQATPSPLTNTSTPQVVKSSPTPTLEVATSPTPTTSPSVINSAPTAVAKAIPLKPPTNKAQLISADGIGVARVGMTLGDLKQLLAGKAEFTVKSPFIVDFDAIAVSQGGKDQFYILYPTLLRLADTDLIEALVTDNPNYRTAEGVGPGTLIKDAKTAYGEANLAYSSQNESREYVKFTKLNTKAIAFRVKPPQGKPVAGIYSASKGDFKQTKDFQQAATINLVEVYCRENCPLPKP
jgi:hypothetical protein